MTGLPEFARTLVDARHVVALATLNPDGSPQTSPVWVDRDGDDVLVSTAAGRRKVTNVERDPRVSLTVWDPADDERYVEIRGTAVVEPDPGRAFAIALGEKYDGPGGGDSFRDLPAEVVRVILRITPTRVVLG
ncbi:PPOX class F420-dependent oxidoreductase [Pseudonocardia sp. CA-107938]|uniref:PPOX class F420-dependent oxidoreductase n=1 Tax=Pseudonocardia sp. CA-107938 TaxID=3240021 RepID=UPI003D9456CB